MDPALVSDDPFDDTQHPDASRWGRRLGPDLVTLALDEDVAAVLHQHGYPPPRGYALADLTAALCRLTLPLD
jgi:hypothetical protein